MYPTKLPNIVSQEKPDYPNNRESGLLKSLFDKWIEEWTDVRRIRISCHRPFCVWK